MVESNLPHAPRRHRPLPPMPRARLALWLPLAAVLFGAVHASAQPAPAARAVFFAPLEVEPALELDEPLLRDSLAAGMLATGRFAEAASTVTQEALGQCIRQVNRDVNDAACWIRLGQGQGAELLASGRVTGDRRACTLSLRLTELESRLSRRMHVGFVRPCDTPAVLAELGRGAAALAGVAAPSGARPAQGRSAGGDRGVQPAPLAPTAPLASAKTAATDKLEPDSTQDNSSALKAAPREPQGSAGPAPDERRPKARSARPGASAAPPQAQPRWVALEGGTFSMGSKTGDPDERPVRTVRVPGFEISATEITVAEYRRCVEAGACSAERLDGGRDWAAQTLCTWDKADRERHPINCLDWEQAVAYAGWIGGGARLCSEAEWEYAARSGGNDQVYPWGDEAPGCRLAHMDDTSVRASGWQRNGCGSGVTAPVCSLERGNSKQVVCDLAGNVGEWVADAYHGTYAGAPTDGSADVPRRAGRVERVHRGGSLKSAGTAVRARRRDKATPRAHFFEIGLRLCRRAAD